MGKSIREKQRYFVMCSCVDRIKDQLEHIRNLCLAEYRLLLAVTLWQLHIVLELQRYLKMLFTYDFFFLIKNTLPTPTANSTSCSPKSVYKL